MSQTRSAGWAAATVAVLCAAVAWSQPAPPQTETPRRAQADGNCGWRSVLGLAELRQGVVGNAAVLNAFRERPTSTLAEVKEMATLLGLPLPLVKLTAQELGALSLPALVHAREPSHFTVLLGVSLDRVWLWDGPGKPIGMVARAAFERAFSGYAGVGEAAADDGAWLLRGVAAGALRHRLCRAVITGGR